MEQKPNNRLPPLSVEYPWLVAQNLDGTGDQTFYNIHNPLCHYHCRIPKLLGRRIRGYFHGWVILSNKNLWSIWNPVTSKVINLPPLTLDKSESIGQCCLSSPPDDPISVLLLTITGKPTFVFCRLGFKKNMLRWKRMLYSRQLRETTGYYGGLLRCLTFYNGKVYALWNCSIYVVDIIVQDGEVLIELFFFARLPNLSCSSSISLLKGSCTGLFCIKVVSNEVTKETVGKVYLFKWVMSSMRWEEMVDMKDAIFFLDLAHDDEFVYYNHAIASDLGGYIHVRDRTGKMMYSYDVEDKTISLSSMAYPTSHVSLWECRLEGGRDDSDFTRVSKIEKDEDDKMVVRSVTDDGVELNESHLLNLPLHLLEMIMDRCIGVEYMRFRATCKRCHLAAPPIKWSNRTTLRRLDKYSLLSPWLMVVDNNRRILTFTDPVLGETYFMRRLEVPIHNDRILCSRFGWLLLYDKYYTMMFFNPFTNDIREVPYMLRLERHIDSGCFSAPPTSPDCMVVVFNGCYIYINSVVRDQTWRVLSLDFRVDKFCFPTFHGQDLYVQSHKGEFYALENLFKSQGYCYRKVTSARSCEGEYFLVKCDQQLLLVTVGGKFGEYVEVFKLNEYNKVWEKVNCLGRYAIYICRTTCLCIEAKTSEMENKIFFPRLHSKNGKVVFYSLETCRYYRFNGKKIEEIVGDGVKHTYSHAWVEPTWS